MNDKQGKRWIVTSQDVIALSLDLYRRVMLAEAIVKELTAIVGEEGYPVVNFDGDWELEPPDVAAGMIATWWRYYNAEFDYEPRERRPVHVLKDLDERREGRDS